MTETKKIIVWYGKGDEVYLDASTPEQWARSSLHLLKLMDEWGCYVEATDPAHLKAIADNDLSFVTIGRGRFERTIPRAWELLQDHHDYEYERVELEEVLCP